MSSTKKKYIAPKFKELVFTEVLQSSEINAFPNSLQNQEGKLLEEFAKLLEIIKTESLPEIKY